jgi:hypothetical protein
MSFEESLRSITLNADDTVGFYTGVPGVPGSAVPNTGKQYCFLKVTGELQVGLAVAPGDKVVGVLQNKPQMVGAAATVGIRGITNVQVGGVFDAGDQVQVNASGQAIKAVSAENGVGTALLNAVKVGSIVPVLLDVR